MNARAEVDADGFGGYTPLFVCVVSRSYLCGRQRDAAFACLLLDHGAGRHARASRRKQLRFVPDETTHEYRDATPLAWGERFHGQSYHSLVCQRATQVIVGRGRHG